MNAQPNPSQTRAFGAPPPAPSGTGRLLPFAKMAATGSVLVALGLYGAQLFLPHDYKPSVVAGWAAGLTVRAEIEASQEAKIDMDRRMADAAAQANAKAQADLAAINKVLEERTAALQTQSTLAGLADVLCIGGMGVAALGSQNTGTDWHNGATALAKSSCGVGNQLRANIAQSQIEALHTAAAARGMSMTDGSKPVPALPPAPVRQPAPPVAINLAQVPHNHLNADQQRDLRLYAQGMPVEVLRLFVDGLDMAHGYPDAWYDRVAYYREAQHG